MIINTRPIYYESAMLHDLAGYTVITSPVMTARPVPWPISALDSIDALIVTSQIALDCLDMSLVSHDLPIYVVGQATAAAAQNAGFADVNNGGGTAKKLLSVIDDASFNNGLYLSARHVSLDLACERPARIKRQVVYEMLSSQSFPHSVIDILTAGQRVVVPFYSPRSFEIFESLIAQHSLKHHLLTATAIAIHPRVFAKKAHLWDQTLVAAVPDGAGMIEALKTAA